MKLRSELNFIDGGATENQKIQINLLVLYLYIKVTFQRNSKVTHIESLKIYR